MVGIGKIYQRLGGDEGALSWFLKALEIEPNNASAAKEAGITGAVMGDHAEAIHLTTIALNTAPERYGLVIGLKSDQLDHIV